MSKTNLDGKSLYLSLKRIIDIVLAFLSLIIVIPVVIILSLIIVIDSKGSPIYSQMRLGKDKKEFKIYKLRSMYVDAEKHGPQWAEVDDTRVTRVGKIIRLLRIDEFPQIFNILKGDMSIIGPRPERKIFHEKFKKTIPNFDRRLDVKPGLTGWAQVNGGYEITPKEKLELDLYYINNISFSLDMKIIFKTIKVVFTREDAR